MENMRERGQERMREEGMRDGFWEPTCILESMVVFFKKNTFKDLLILFYVYECFTYIYVYVP